MRPVLIGPADPAWTVRLETIAATARRAAADVPSSLRLARSLGQDAPHSASGSTARRWALLATLGAADLTVARVVEPHLDAIEIRHQAGLADDLEHTRGVFAAEGPGVKVTAVEGARGWRLDGVKPWCSLAGDLDRCLITAHTAGGSRRLFECALDDPGVVVSEGGWAARGLAAVRSERIELTDVPAEPVGDDGWYLHRDGFAWGGIGVAAIWFGAAVALGRELDARLHEREADQLALAHLGEVDVLLHAGATVLAAAAAEVDAGTASPAILAQRVRSAISAAAERILTISGHALGPAPLALDEEHARRVADLQLYLRQDHAERDLARLGSKVHGLEVPPW